MTDTTLERGPARRRAGAGPRRESGAPLAVIGVLIAVGAAAAAGTLAVTFLPSLKFAYRDDAVHATIETAAFLVATVAAVLVGGRALRSGARTDVLLAAALAVLAATNLLFSLVPALSGWSAQFSTWAALVGRVSGAILFAAAALLPARRLEDPPRALRTGGALLAAGVGVVYLVAGLLGDRLPDALDPALTPETASEVRLIGSPVILAVQGLLIIVYAAATGGFAARARRDCDRLLRGFAAACLLAAFARVHYFLFPSVFSEWVHTGDVLRLVQYLVVLGVVGVEVLDYQRKAAAGAVLDERRRVARELHDGLAQELAFIRGSATRLQRGGELDVDRLRELVSAADRAIDESRAAIAALTRPLEEPLLDALRHGAQPIAARSGAHVRVTGNEGARVDDDRRHALLRIVREATGNATRHGKAKLVTITVRESDEGLRVTIADDGSGFDPAADVRPDAYGLSGMQERAEAFGGRLEVRSAQGAGTEVEVVLP